MRQIRQTAERFSLFKTRKPDTATVYAAKITEKNSRLMRGDLTAAEEKQAPETPYAAICGGFRKAETA